VELFEQPEETLHLAAKRNPMAPSSAAVRHSHLRVGRLAILVVLLAVTGAQARDMRERAAFKREHPCPATGLRRGPCPGYVIDHVQPLCAGGPDKRANMQWQTVPDGLRKDAAERRLCRALRAK
jgi:hypothetical protein